MLFRKSTWLQKACLLLFAALVGCNLGLTAYRTQHLPDTDRPVSLTKPDESIVFAVTVNTEDELQRALNAAVQGTRIRLGRDMTLSKPLEINKQNMALKLEAAADTITLTAPSSRHFRCAGSNIDLLFERIILEGGGRGGGIYSTVNGLSLGGVTVRGCYSGGSGGGVEAAAGSLFLENGTLIQGNRAAAYGGGVSTGQGVTLQVDGGTISGNEAGAYGGGVFGGVGSRFYLDGGRISENKAVLGGGLYAGLANTIHLDGGEISGNTASGGGTDGGRGGGIYAVTCDIVINGAKVTENQAAFGGGIYATGDGSDIILSGGTIGHNTATGADAYGGGIYLDTAYSVANTLTVTRGEITANHGVRGGGVYAGGSAPGTGSSNPGSSKAAVITINGGVIGGNTAGLGGGIYGNPGCPVYLGDGEIKENTAQDGGGIWIEPLQSLKAEQGVTFSGNRADTGVRFPSQEDIVLHKRQILTASFSGDYDYGYNNHDIVYDGGEAETETHTVRFLQEGEPALEWTIPHGEAIGGPLPEPVRSGYSFTGWFTQREGGEKVTPSTRVLADLTLYARWQPNTYKILFEYDIEPPEGAVFEQDVVYGQRVGYLPILSNPSGQAFLGWFDTDQNHYFPATIYLFPGNLVLTPHWSDEGTVHRVTFHYNEATGVSEESRRTVAHRESIGDLPQPEKTGHLFTGWYEEGGSHAWEKDDLVLDELNLFARWEQKPYTIRFHYTGMDDTGLDKEKSVSPGDTLGALPAPQLPGLHWRGWYADSGLTTPVTGETVPSGDMDLYARWDGYILFDYQGETLDESLPDQKEVAYGHKIGALPMPTRSGSFFAGWFTQPNGGGRYFGGGTSGKAFDQTEDLPLFASWQDNVYTITFDYQGGHAEGGPTHKQVVYGDNVAELPFPQREGYRFAGWFSRPGGGGSQYFVGTSYLVNSNATLYAHWVSDAPGPLPQPEPRPIPSSPVIPDYTPPLTDIPDNSNPGTGR